MYKTILKTSLIFIPFSLVRYGVLLYIFFFPVAFLRAQSDCVLRKDQDGIKVYACPSDDSKFKSIKASFYVNTSLTKLASMVLNINNYDRWQYNTVNPRILKTISNHEIIYYVEVEAPWPVANRDMIIHLTIIQDPLTKVVTIHANGEPDYLPVNEGLVRVPMSKSKWTVTPLKDGLRVEYNIQIDPGGSVPAWMVNMVCAEAPYTSFKNLKENIVKQKDDVTFLKD